MPRSVRAALTSSILNGLTIAVTSFIRPSRSIPPAGDVSGLTLCLDGLPGLAGRDEHRVPGGGEGRGVGEVEAEHLLDGEVGGEGGGEDVDALGRALPTHDLAADEVAAA